MASTRTAVYLVIGDIDESYDNDHVVLGVFTTREKAQAFVDRVNVYNATMKASEYRWSSSKAAKAWRASHPAGDTHAGMSFNAYIDTYEIDAHV